MPEQKREQTLQRVQQRLQEMGDMPIFSASVNRIHRVGADPDADAMALAVEILKDANLSAKVLKLANSPLHNRSRVRIGNLSRAVVVLGFETVRSTVLTLKLIDSFQQQNPEVDITGLLVSAYLSATFVRGIASRCEVRDIEQSYICGLLHNLGEVAVACTLPQEYRRILSLQREEQLPRQKAEIRKLGATLHDLGQAIANDWEFPKNVVQTLGARQRNRDGPIRNQTELTGALATLSAQTMNLLYAEHPDDDKTLPELLYELSRVAGIKKEQVSEALEQAFRQCCDMAQAYGLDRRHLTPRLRGGKDESLDKLARQFSFYARQELPDTEAAGSPAAEAAGNPARLLDCLYEITTLMSQQASINTIFAKVLDGLHRGAGFDRALLCLLSPDHRRYAGRLAAGEGAEALMAQCQFPLAPADDLFSRLIIEGGERRVDIHQDDWPLPADFARISGADSFLIAALHGRQQRPVGLFYADRARSHRVIDNEAQRNFRQLVAQAQLALQMR